MRTFKNNVCNFIFSRSRLITAFSLFILVLALINIVLQLMSSFRYVQHSVQVDGSHERSSRLLKNVGNVYERKFDNEVGTTTSLFNGSTYHRYQKTLPKCQVVHIGIVCAGSKSNLFLHSMLKSMYFYRTSPLHFHIVTTDDSREVLELLFNTWNVPEVAVSFYDADDHLSEVSWISNTHYSGVYGLLKLIIPKIIQHTVTKRIIVIDTDLIFLDDIAKLWKLFNSFNHDQAIGVVENQSNYYLQRTYPVIGAGYNTGVILFQLDKLEKQYDWSRLWVRVTRRLSLTHGTMRCGDQDIINAIIVEHPEILHSLPCQWNIQLSTNTFSADCYENRDIKVVHWNSPQKFNVENRDKDYFRAIYQTFLEYNGNLLKRQLFYCTTKRGQKQLYVFSENETEGCSNFWWSQNHTWRTLLFITEYKYTAVSNDVTYVVQLSFDRLQMIEELSKHWKGPINIVLYITDSDLQRCIDFIQNSVHLKDRTDIAYHAVFKEGDYYPINLLRNVAMRYVNTPYIFLADIDFVPMVSLYESIKTHICNMGSMIKKALIVPAFETQRYRSKLPKNKKELIKMLGSKSLSTFRYDVWPSGQIVTNYTKWANAKVPYEVKWQPDFEPYVVVQKDVVEYDKRFVGFGWNKVSHIMELEALGYKFIVLPNAFTIHKPHAPSDSIKKFRSSYAYRKCLDDLKKQFVEELYKKYGRQFHSPTIQMV